MYASTFFSKDELQALLKDRLDPIDLNRVISAYEMADVSIGTLMDENNCPLFFKCTRYAKILINEAGIYDPDLIITALLFTTTNYDKNLSNTILAYNFGVYIQLLCDLLNSNIDNLLNTQKLGMIESEFISRRPEADYFIISLAVFLDNLRIKYDNPDLNTINYLNFITGKIIPAAEKINDENVSKLNLILKQEGNKFIN